MLRAVRSLAASRIAAAIVAVAMSGAPRMAATIAPPGEHRCRCPSLGRPHVCECPVCRAAAARARRADLAKLPPCHRAAAEKALADEERAGRGAGPRITCPCGPPQDGSPPPRSGEEFTLPAAWALAAAGARAAAASSGGEGLESPRVPETPPPRTA